MKIIAAQVNPIVGDIVGNTTKILHWMDRARVQKADIIVFPELAMCGYPPRDLLFFSDFIDEIEKNLKKIIEKSHGLFVAVGLPRRTEKKEGKPLYNSVAVICDEKLLGYKDKTLLPDYDVFNELRYFEPHDEQKVWEYKDKKIGIIICEDAWQQSAYLTNVNYSVDPVASLKKLAPDLCLVPAASPYYYKKNDLRKTVYHNVAKYLGCPLILCSQVGANDQLVFDGYSMFFDARGVLCHVAKGFVEEEFFIDPDNIFCSVEVKEDALEDLYHALVLGVKDYFSKLGFSKACLGLSGGVDSALTACIAADALGPHNIKALRMPSRYSSVASMEDAQALSENLRIELLDIPIDGVFQQFLDLLGPFFHGKPFDATEENLQARIRGMVLMGISNKLGYVVLSTGNKSEMAMGYVTLYGDMCGGLSVLGDVSKTVVYKLASWINKSKEIIPKNIITKIPSAELKANQKDQDTLPPYEIVDLVLEEYVENHKSIEEIISENKLSKELVRALVERIHLAEYKRRQGPPNIRVTKKGFGVGRIFPIVQRWI